MNTGTKGLKKDLYFFRQRPPIAESSRSKVKILKNEKELKRNLEWELHAEFSGNKNGIFFFFVTSLLKGSMFISIKT